MACLPIPSSEKQAILKLREHVLTVRSARPVDCPIIHQPRIVQLQINAVHDDELVTSRTRFWSVSHRK
jgi:hypothetical protein